MSEKNTKQENGKVTVWANNTKNENIAVIFGDKLGLSGNMLIDKSKMRRFLDGEISGLPIDFLPNEG